MIKILFVANQMGTGADPLYWGKLWECLSQTGFNVEVMTTQKFKKSNCPSVKLEKQLKMIGFARFQLPTLGSLKYMYSQKFNIIILNEFSFLSFIICIYSRLCLKRPRIILLVENHPKYLLGYGVSRQTKFYRIQRKIQTYLVDLILTNNREGGSYLAHELKVPSLKILVSPYLTSVFDRQPQKTVMMKTPSLPIRIVTVGQLIHRKGFHLVLDELSQLSSKFRRQFKIEIFGGGPEKKSLKAAIEVNSLKGCITLRGKVPYIELAKYLSDAHVFLIPTLGDYRSLASFEAISLGLPIIMSKHDGALNEVLVEGCNGWSYDPQKKGDLGRVLQVIFEDRKCLRDFAYQSKIIAEQFTVEKVVDSFVKSFQLVGL